MNSVLHLDKRGAGQISSLGITVSSGRLTGNTASPCCPRRATILIEVQRQRTCSDRQQLQGCSSRSMVLEPCPPTRQ